MSYVHKGYKWDQNDIVISNIFAFKVAVDIIRDDEDPEPYMWKNVDIELVGQNGKKLCKQN